MLSSAAYKKLIKNNITNINMKKPHALRIITLLLIPFLFSFTSSNASNTVIVVDGSGSVAGMSQTRPHNSIRFITAELTDYLSKLSDKDTVSLIHFTDKIQGIYTYAGYNSSIKSVIDSLRFIPKGNTDFSVALNALNGISDYHRVVFITDGLNNSGSTDDVICNRLKQISNTLNGEVFFLLLNEVDIDNPIIQLASKSEGITLVKSLSAIPPFSSQITIADEISDEKTDDSVLPTDKSVTQINDSNEKSCCSFDWKYVNIALIVLLCIAVIALICYLIYQFWPLFAEAGAGAIQQAIFVLYNLPKGLFDIVFNVLPESMKAFLTEIMPSRDAFKFGEVIPASEQQAKALEAMRQETGKAMRYKNGEIDFSPVSKYKVKLRGSLDKNIPETLDPINRIPVGVRSGNGMGQLDIRNTRSDVLTPIGSIDRRVHDLRSLYRAGGKPIINQHRGCGRELPVPTDRWLETDSLLHILVILPALVAYPQEAVQLVAPELALQGRFCIGHQQAPKVVVDLLSPGIHAQFPAEHPFADTMRHAGIIARRKQPQVHHLLLPIEREQLPWKPGITSRREQSPNVSVLCRMRHREVF